MKGFPNKDHQIDTITGIPERMVLNIMFEALTENTVSSPTLKVGGRFGLTAMMVATGTFQNCDFTTTEINFLIMDRKISFERGLSLCLTKFRSRKKFKRKKHREHGKPKSQNKNSI